MRTYYAWGWLEADDSQQKPADVAAEVRAKSDADADMVADRKFKREFGDCSLVITQPKPKGGKPVSR